jgi:phosphoglycerol transferase MdoB-like AlkP superfamily enzyme
LPGWTALFLFTTVLTSLTGFVFPIKGFTPALGGGAVSLVVLAIALWALYGKHLAGRSRWIYVVTAVTALWFNVLVLIVQAFEKVSFLKPLAPTQSEPPFIISQAAAMVLFVLLGILAVIKFRPGAPRPA